MKIFLLVLFFYTSQVSSQTISCTYGVDWISNAYTCNLTINNPTSFDGFTNIPGEHVQGFSNSDVRDINFLTRTTTIFPQIICQQFPFTESIRQQVSQLDIQTLSENSFKACSNLRTVRLPSPLTSIHPRTFYNNPNLWIVSFTFSLMLTLPSDLFKHNPLLANANFDHSQIVELPPTLFNNNPELTQFTITSTHLQQVPTEFFRNNTRLRSFNINSSRVINQLPRNFVNSNNLVSFQLFNTGIRQIDFFSLNQVQNLDGISFVMTEIEAIDFNILDRARNLRSFLGASNACAELGTSNFNANREANMAILEPCFVAFDERILAFSTTSTNQLFNSIRRERLRVSIQTLSDAILTFSNSPDGSGSNFEIQLGADDNRNSFLYENGILRSSRATPGLLNVGQFVEFEISWQNGLIIVSDRSPILVHIRDDLFPVRFVGVRTRGSNASWRIQQFL